MAEALPGIPGPHQEVGRVQTQREGLRLQGFTETIYVADGTGRQWTLYYNPRRNLYGGRHPSDGDRHRGI